MASSTTISSRRRIVVGDSPNMIRFALMRSITAVGRRFSAIWSIGASLSCSSTGSSSDDQRHQPDPRFEWDLPAWFVAPDVPANNPMSAGKVELGRHLFYDTRLSANRTQSCASCHDQALAFSDGRPKPVGSTGEVHVRNAPSLVNVAYASSLTWVDPELQALELQARRPLFGDDPVEMGMGGREQEMLERITLEPRYDALLNAAFPERNGRLSVEMVLSALAAFQRTLISGGSRFDQYLNGDAGALSPQELRGMRLYYSERTNCFRCHGGFNFDQATTDIDSEPPNFHNTGLYDVDGRGGYPSVDTGLFALSQRPSDMGKFRTPSLRNVALTAPYMHDGSVPTLLDVLDHYAAGGRASIGDSTRHQGSLNPFKHPLVSGFELSVGERDELRAFLSSLTDQELLHDEQFRNPW